MNTHTCQDTDLAHILDTELLNWNVVATPLVDATNAVQIEIMRQFTFDSFQSAIDFMTQTAPGCDTAKHHPRWENTWKTLTIYLSTWDEGLYKITEKDIKLAKYFDQAYSDFLQI